MNTIISAALKSYSNKEITSKQLIAICDAYNSALPEDAKEAIKMHISGLLPAKTTCRVIVTSIESAHQTTKVEG